ncbi:DUF87 domain-containing protein [Candidatus Peregrinibacteria bacterium]|jgi:hypothetical protein|nr:DUF87 domain-containing protein [Candidatus Peregrinibacteria bacterium]MBT4056334.1 DUF87 domain-containing protein [Candidatus Peregrinibacteria bacterium]
MTPAPTTDNVLMLIKVAHDNDKDEVVFEQLLDTLHGVVGGAKFSLEIVSLHQHIYLFVWCKQAQMPALKGQIYAEYPHAEIEFLKDYSNVDLKATGLKFAGAELGLRRSDLYPIKTYDMFEGSSMAAVFSYLTKTQESEQGWVQIVLSPSSGEGRFSFGKKFNLRIRSFLNKFDIRKLFRTKSRVDILKKERDMASKKFAKDTFKASVRIAYFAPDQRVATQKLRALANTFSIFDEQDLNSFKAVKFTTNPSFLREYGLRRFASNRYIFNIQEIATIYHLPKGAKDAVPNLVCTVSKKAEPPMDLPKEGNVDPKTVSFFARTNFHNQYLKFGITRADRRRHLYVVGKSGVGKSKLLELLIVSDILNGEGVGVLDPHGDLVENVLKYVPDHRAKDVVVFNPADMEYPIGFNPIESVEMEYRQHVAMGFIEIFKKLFGDNWTFRLEHVMRYTVLALFDYPNSTIFGILKMLTDKNYRQKVVSHINDTVVKNFWVNEFAAWSEKFDNEAIVPILNKIGQFVSTALVRNIVGQPQNRMDMDDIMNNQKILLMNVSKGTLSEEISGLIGAMIITSLYRSAMKRAAMAEDDRKDFYFYVDEFQNFATRTFGEILSEARKYRLNLCVSHQHLGQLDDYTKSMVFGNVGSMISFRVGAEDAFNLEREYTPVFKANDMINLGVREFYVKMTIEGKLRDPFSGYTLDVPKPVNDLSSEIIEYSRKTYGKPRNEVEAMIEQMEKGYEKDGSATTDEDEQVMPGEENFSAPLV